MLIHVPLYFLNLPILFLAVNLYMGVTVATITHDNKINWLEVYFACTCIISFADYEMQLYQLQL